MSTLPRVRSSQPRHSRSAQRGGALFGHVAGDTANHIMRVFKQAASRIKLDFKDLGGSLKTTMKGIGISLISHLKSTAMSLLKQVGGNLLGRLIPGGGLFPSVMGLFGRASGGRVQPGMPTLVGERGAELIVPDRAATIINAGDSQHVSQSNSAPHVTQNFSITADVRDSVRAQIYSHLPAIEARIMDKLTRARAGIR